MAKRRTKRSKRRINRRWFLLGLPVVGLAIWVLWPKKAQAETPGDAGGSGTTPEGQIVSNDPWTLRTYPHSAAGTRVKVASTEQVRNNNNQARVRRDYRTTEGSWLIAAGTEVGTSTGRSVRWQGIRFIELDAFIGSQPIKVWVAADLVTRS